MVTHKSKRLLDLADSMLPKWRARFLAVVKQIKDDLTLSRIEGLLISGSIEEAILLSETAALQLGRVWGDTYVLAGDDAAGFVSGALNMNLNFNTMNARAVQQMQENSLRMVRQFTNQQRRATNAALRDGIARGLNPRQQAVAFRDSIGLTGRQMQAVHNYRSMLEGRHRYLNVEQGLKESLRRKLKDGRWNATVERAIKNGTPIPQATVDKMVDRYTQRYLKYRSEVIARTESLRAVHMGTEEMYEQAFDNGTLQRGSVIRTWDTSKDGRVRASHRAMDRQQRPVGEPFITGNGNQMRFPTDPAAPPEESVQDRCAVTTRFKKPPT
jgi:hypothetical protein